MSNRTLQQSPQTFCKWMHCFLNSTLHVIVLQRCIRPRRLTWPLGSHPYTCFPGWVLACEGVSDVLCPNQFAAKSKHHHRTLQPSRLPKETLSNSQTEGARVLGWVPRSCPLRSLAASENRSSIKVPFTPTPPFLAHPRTRTPSPSHHHTLAPWSTALRRLAHTPFPSQARTAPCASPSFRPRCHLTFLRNKQRANQHRYPSIPATATATLGDAVHFRV